MSDETERAVRTASLVARERERQDLAETLRDDVAQSLAGLALSLDLCARAVDTNSDLARQEIARARTALAGTIGRLRRRIYELQPRVLDDAGLVSTLRRYVSQWTEITVTFDDRFGDQRRGGEIERALFRTTQLALHDAAQRGASAAAVCLESDGRLVIEHDASDVTVCSAGDDIDLWVGSIDGHVDVTPNRITVHLPSDGATLANA